MSGLLVLAIIVALIAVIGVLAQEFGTDSRSGSVDPRLPVRDLSL